MHLTVEVDREDDGRWIASLVEVPGVMAYGAPRHEAIICTLTLLVDVLRERAEHGEPLAADD